MGHKYHSHKQNNTNVTQGAKQEQKGRGREQKAGGMVANKGASKTGSKTGRCAKGFSMFNFQIGLSRMTFS